MPRLVFMRGQTRLLEYKVHPGRTMIGRADNCDLVVPGETVSRTHCVITGREGAWTLRDRSRHGTQLNGRPIQDDAPLKDGDVIGVGGYALRFSEAADAASRPTLSTRAAGHVPAEQLVASDDQLTVKRLVLVVDEGPAAGERHLLTRSQQEIGGPGSRVALGDPELAHNHLTIQVNRGRAILIPGRGPVVVDGERVTAALPVFVDEPVVAGQTVFHLAHELAVERPEADSFGTMVGASAAFRGIFGVLRRVSLFDAAAVLLQGESGTGKELAARGLHDEGPRASGPFVAVNCGAIAETLFESELFGHERGAFTGAERRTDGAFQAADGGTLFLDEIGELPESAQAKLLRALESGEVRRVGGTRVSYPDVRVVAATNRDLEEEVKAGRFRADLYFRLAVIVVKLPPLRERPEDLPIIAMAIASRLGQDVSIMPDALEALRRHSFPGNARELRNVLTRALVMGGPRISASAISFTPWSFEHLPTAADPASGGGVTLETTQRMLIQDAMRRHSGNRSAVARELGVARSTLASRIRSYGLED
ncbi:MAG: sigma 54-interacting transcriptional regulator [Alphaproteobacteria bacterium]|nr:sigma 54-interacting transcriptional regulator [Alphaproteobacteria bacterium]